MILALYDPGQASAGVARIQYALHCLQRSPQGWQLAQSLLDKPALSPSDVRIKFYGALTITVKLNTERYARRAGLHLLWWSHSC